MKKALTPIALSFIGLLAAVTLLAFIPTEQDPGIQANIWAGETITTTAKTSTVACHQGAGSIGRKTLIVHNGADATNSVTVTAELRDDLTTPNYTSGYLAVTGLATNTASSDTAVATDAAGRYCYVSAVATGTAIITVSLRRE